MRGRDWCLGGSHGEEVLARRQGLEKGGRRGVRPRGYGGARGGGGGGGGGGVSGGDAGGFGETCAGQNQGVCTPTIGT
jgi:hypothetical protein